MYLKYDAVTGLVVRYSKLGKVVWFMHGSSSFNPTETAAYVSFLRLRVVGKWSGIGPLGHVPMKERVCVEGTWNR